MIKVMEDNKERSKDLKQVPETELHNLEADLVRDFKGFEDSTSKVTPEKVISIDAESTIQVTKNWNPVVNAMADAQNVEVGSWDWMLGGPAPWSGSAGEQSSYGWRHTHKLTPKYIRSVLANYGHRRSYYTHEPFRQFHYSNAGRPHGWEPESPGDMANGTTTYMTSRGPIVVSGPDAEHLWLTPLFALIDDPNPILVDTGMGNKLPSNIVAKFIATLLVSSAIGMVRDKNGDGTQPYPWTYGDRATGRLLHTIVEGMKRGCVLPNDIPTAAFFLKDIVLPFYESPPGIHSFGDPREGKFPMGLFNGLGWIIPACYDAATLLRDIPYTESWADRFMSLVSRWSQWMIDMNEVLPSECFRADRVFLDPAFTQGGPGGMPFNSIIDLITPDDFLFSFDFKPWTFRAVDIAAKVSGNSSLDQERDRIIDEYGSDYSKKQWIVGADGEYLT